ncbi:MAG: SDR family oxidoreductase [Solimonas sp.]
MTRFADKHVLITGGTSGIGLAGARRIVAEGGKTVVTGLDRSRVADAGKALGAGNLAVADDASAPDAGAQLAGRIADWGRLDGLWFNAGFANIDSIETLGAEYFDRMMNANVRGPMLQLAKLSPLINDGASIVITASIAAYADNAATATYAVTKAALIALTRSWARALAPRGIRVNSLVPGPIESRLRDFLPKADRIAFEKNTVSQVPLARVGKAEEAAAVALFLLSEDASYVTGSQYFVDGGIVMH